MARIDFGSMDALIDRIGRESERFQRNALAAVTAGGEMAADCMRTAIPIGDDGHGHSGHLQGSITVRPSNGGRISGYSCEIGPEGTRDDGEPYAKIGNILEYGTSSMAARPWMRTAMQQNEAAIVAEMKEVLMRD